MKKLKEYLVEAAEHDAKPAAGDDFAFDYGDQCLVETYIMESTDDSITVYGDAKAFELLESHGYLGEAIGRYGAVGSNSAMGYSIAEKNNQGVAEGDDDLVDLGPALRDLTGEFNKFIKHDDRMKTDPAYAKKWNKRYAKYAGNNDHDIYDDPEDDERGVAEGEGLGYSRDPEQAKWYHEGRNAHKGGTTGSTIQDIAKKHGCPAEWVDAFRAGYQDQAGWSEKAVSEEQKTFKRMMELAGVGDYKFNQEDDIYREDQDAAVVAQKELDDAVTNPMPGVHEEIERDQSPVERAILHRILMQRPSMLQKYGPEQVMSAVEEVADFVGDVEEIGSSDVSGWIRHVEQLLSNMENQVDEAEYQGRNVPLGKPMRGDVKKFKVYVKDPSTGNIKKVNFGHGGTSAKRAGQKTMKIKKSNPARRKSFRARHNCDNPGPRTKARYWSCRAW